MRMWLKSSQPCSAGRLPWTLTSGDACQFPSLFVLSSLEYFAMLNFGRKLENAISAFDLLVGCRRILTAHWKFLRLACPVRYSKSPCLFHPQDNTITYHPPPPYPIRKYGFYSHIENMKIRSVDLQMLVDFELGHLFINNYIDCSSGQVVNGDSQLGPLFLMIGSLLTMVFREPSDPIGCGYGKLQPAL